MFLAFVASTMMAALPVEATPLDTHLPTWAARRRAQLRTPEQVNQFVNARVAYERDESGDRWQSARETLASRRGDCEDYAIAKLALLRAAGWRPTHLRLVVTFDHAVAAVLFEDEWLVLDNLTPEIRTRPDLQPVFSFGLDGSKWLHGRRRDA